MSGFSSASGTKRTDDPSGHPPSHGLVDSQPQMRTNIFGRQSSVANNEEDTDDTMKNLRKTFAGIFGDM